MANSKLDLIDNQIIKILQENCKITNLELSKRVGLSPAPTLERVKKLESNGVLASYHAHVNRNAIGLNVQTYLLVEIAWNMDNALDNFLEKVNEIDEVVECYIITGEADALMKIICKDIPTYENLLFNTLSKIEEIGRLKTLMTLSQVKNSYVLPHDYDQGEE
ncbi:Lrp/AsnC family transcriptional regulator [Membranicola marinus]|uniref:Lrp/AsnC family transcriptional regulator n=1 Tax=Membranihabitans marinus TaxID=1227546 RepID=A0A953HXT0_9BACT|nr:Lrp/AsnC family transcriptional regulator [Membranihabitans marinus]MBY5960111.1 Lrp/AsnC family transcriptional regulator [Membranihabitans marinus]